MAIFLFFTLVGAYGYTPLPMAIKKAVRAYGHTLLPKTYYL